MGELTGNFANIADAHAGVEKECLFFTQDEVGNGFFRLMRFVNGEDLRNDSIDLEPGIVDRDAFQSLVFGPREWAAPLRFLRLGCLCDQNA